MTDLPDGPHSSNVLKGRWAPLSIGAVALTFWLHASAAYAEFTVCNQTLDVVNVAIGQQVENIFQTEGWWTIGSNQCATTIREELKNRYIYVFANDVFGQSILDGTVPMCTGPDKFTIAGTDSCWQRGYQQAKFFEVDTQAVQRWTLFWETKAGSSTMRQISCRSPQRTGHNSRCRRTIQLSKAMSMTPGRSILPFSIVQGMISTVGKRA